MQPVVVLVTLDGSMGSYNLKKICKSFVSVNSITPLNSPVRYVVFLNFFLIDKVSQEEEKW